MGSPLGPVIAGIFMVELERTLVPKLAQHMYPWNRYVDDTIAWIKQDSVEYVTQQLNSFHENIQFTYEMESDNKISFLDILLIRKNDSEIETTVYRKPTDNDIYLNWNSFAPIKWKRGTLRTLLLRAHTICSNENHLKTELKHLHKAFIETNGYPEWIYKQVYQKIKADKERINNEDVTPEIVNNEIVETRIMLPYQGQQGEKLLKSLTKTLNHYEKNHVTKIIYTGTKLGTNFTVKDKTIKEHQHDLVYEVKCPEPTCKDSYIGEVSRRLGERIKDHCGRDSKSHVVTHTMESNHKEITKDDFTIISKNKRMNNYYFRKIMEAIMIKRKKPTLNAQEKSVPLKLFN